MCGITGFWKPEGTTDDDFPALQRMMQRLHHRGPDGRGWHFEPEEGLAMGHTRLTIIDLKTGDQPLVSPDKQHVLTANGELYDYKTNRAEFSRRGELFATKSDCETALYMYKYRGLDFVEQLRGEFAIALFDRQERRLVLVRDRFGIKPLYYYFDGTRLFWGSEVKALFAHPEVPRRLCPKASLNQLMHTMVPGSTAFEGIRALLPGHMLVVKREGARLVAAERRYWDMDYPLANEHEKNPDPEPYIDGVASRLIDAVRVRLEADVPVGCYLSGGIDSCSILGLATALQQSEVKAFTISFDHAAYDEAAIAIEMAKRTRANQEILQLTAADLYGEHYVKTLWHAERTFYNTLGVAKWHMSRRVRECGYKVVVTGEGSDEMFAGYPFFKRDYFLHALNGEDDAAVHSERMDKSNRIFQGAILAEEQATHPSATEVIGFTPAWIQPWLLTLEQAKPLLSERTKEELQAYDPVHAIFSALDSDQLKGRHPLDKVQYSWQKTMLEGQILTWGGDRVDMANSMESRPAFLDHHLAEYARRIPPSLRIREGVEKWVLREAMRGILPELLYKREKFAFMAPPAHTDAKKQAGVDRLIAERLKPEQIAELGLLDEQRVREFLTQRSKEQEPASMARNDIILNHILGLHILHQELVMSDG